MINENLKELPEKWCIKRNNDNYKIINQWFIDNNYGTPINNDSFIHINKDDKDYDSVSDIPSGYQEISFEQFKKWVLKEKNDKKPNINDLLEEAKRRYPIGTKFKSTFNNEIYTVDGELKWWINKHYEQNEAIANKGDGLVYVKGKWAKIIELPKLETWIPKIGDWVVVTKLPNNTHWIQNTTKRIFQLVSDNPTWYACNYNNNTSKSSYGLSSCDFRKAEPHEIPKLVESETLVGRYVKCISNQTLYWNFGNYYKILKGNKFEKSKLDIECNTKSTITLNENLNNFELMPIGFDPNQKASFNPKTDNWYVNVNSEGENHPVIQYLNKKYNLDYDGTSKYYGYDNQDNSIISFDNINFYIKGLEKKPIELSLKEFELFFTAPKYEINNNSCKLNNNNLVLLDELKNQLEIDTFNKVLEIQRQYPFNLNQCYQPINQLNRKKKPVMDSGINPIKSTTIQLNKKQSKVKF